MKYNKANIYITNSIDGQLEIHKPISNYIYIEFDKKYDGLVKNLIIVIDDEEVNLEKSYVTRISISNETNHHALLYMDEFPPLRRELVLDHPEYPIQTECINRYRLKHNTWIDRKEYFTAIKSKIYVDQDEVHYNHRRFDEETYKTLEEAFYEHDCNLMTSIYNRGGKNNNEL